MSWLLVWLLSWNVSAELVRPAAACRCDGGIEDRFERPSEFNFGPYTGRCVDSCRFRRSDVLSHGVRALVATNLKHDERYWQARIPVSQVESAEVGFEEFLPGIFHVFLVFHFPESAPVQIASQSSRGPARQIRDLVLSPEGIPPKDGRYNLFDAYFERYLIDVRLLSLEQYTAYSVRKLKHKVNLYTLSLSREELAQVLRSGLNDGDQTSLRVKYRLFSNNCATKTLSFIEAARPTFSPGFLEGLQRGLPVAGPLGTLQIFRQYHLIQGESRSI
jgi:hypothetical protein